MPLYHRMTQILLLIFYLSKYKINESRTESPDSFFDCQTKSPSTFLLSDKKSENTKLSIKFIIILYYNIGMYYINVILYYIVSSYIINIYFKNVIVVPTFIILLYFFLYFITSYYFLYLKYNGNPL